MPAPLISLEKWPTFSPRPSRNGRPTAFRRPVYDLGRRIHHGKDCIMLQYEENGGDTLKRAWQSLLKVYKENSVKWGENGFSVEHTGVTVAGTLERVW